MDVISTWLAVNMRQFLVHGQAWVGTAIPICVDSHLRNSCASVIRNSWRQYLMTENPSDDQRSGRFISASAYRQTDLASWMHGSGPSPNRGQGDQKLSAG
jgi:hypothetical protein